MQGYSGRVSMFSPGWCRCDDGYDLDDADSLPRVLVRTSPETFSWGVSRDQLHVATCRCRTAAANGHRCIGAVQEPLAAGLSLSRRCCVSRHGQACPYRPLPMTII